MLNPFYILLSVLFLFAGSITCRGEEQTFVTAPWDTLIANVQIIEGMQVTDSLKNDLVVHLFDRYHLTEVDYRKFYDNFLNLKIDQQHQFLKQVDIILQLLKQQEIPTVK